MNMNKNINTKEYWEYRFKSGDWENKCGTEQTRLFTLSQLEHLEIPTEFNGTILDFGCASGEALEILHDRFPNAKLIGVDLSENAIQTAKKNYGAIAEFFSGDESIVPDSDIIISSNVFEHLSEYYKIARKLLEKCKVLYIIVPYKEVIVPGDEHVNSFSEYTFSKFQNVKTKVFNSRGWTQYGFKLLFEIYLKNIIKFILNKPTRKRSKQIMFIIQKEVN
ncbi:MAG: class I SAM-dependent methyltransferase [Bacteroidetes bacterium]|nr:class I SAM-dependent methyltransferase [Bacteroidota bacterium]